MTPRSTIPETNTTAGTRGQKKDSDPSHPGTRGGTVLRTNRVSGVELEEGLEGEPEETEGVDEVVETQVPTVDDTDP